MKIEDIENSKFLKKLDNKELTNLASDIRSFLLENISKTGGHLSSNLGVVELTIALLKVFDESIDTILFDVGHQAYTYKILTGRAKEFGTLRKNGGLCGFQSLNEKKEDKYETGHSSTSIGSGHGFAIARDMDKKDFNVISVIGDGSFCNGLSYEALNQIGYMGTKQIIILNDNQMSISENVGAIHNFLDKIRSNKKYEKVKKNTKNVLIKTHTGKGIFSLLNKFKNGLKKIYLKKGSFFEDLGIEYYGPINGHDFNELIKYLNIAKNETKPVLLHVITQKGKGYKYAEEDKIGKYHGISPFNIETGEVINKNNLPSYSEIISSYLYHYMKKNKDIICITPGMCYGSKLENIKEKMPNNFIDVGIAEENALIIANTLALSGKKPFVFIYSTFLQRGYDEIIHDIARCKSPVTLCIDRSGLVPSDGSSHQGLFDIPMLLSIPNMVVSAPKDASEANCLLYTSLSNNVPFSIRYPKISIKYDFTSGENLKIGSWEIVKKGKDGIIITYGDFVNKAINIKNKLDEEGINIAIINARFLKPIDTNLFKEIVSINKPIFVYEESLKNGSLGSILSMEIQKYDYKSVLNIFAIEDTFLTHASRDELLKICKLDEQSIINKIKKFY